MQCAKRTFTRACAHVIGAVNLGYAFARRRTRQTIAHALVVAIRTVSASCMRFVTDFSQTFTRHAQAAVVIAAACDAGLQYPHVLWQYSRPVTLEHTALRCDVARALMRCNGDN